MPIGWFVNPAHESVAEPAQALAEKKMRDYQAYLQNSDVTIERDGKKQATSEEQQHGQ